MKNQNQKLTQLLELANNYPSPHNGQPMVVEKSDENKLAIYFETQRGLTATPISYLFSFVTVGVFVRHLELCAKALGHGAAVQLELPKQEQLAESGRVKCAEVTLTLNTSQPDEVLETTIKNRQTSRKKYTAGLSDDEQAKVLDIIAGYNLGGNFVAPPVAHQAIWLNQRAVFDDMFDAPVRHELDHWLRYDHQDKLTKRDGLSYDCMEMNGNALKFAVRHYQVLHWPVIAQLLKRYYLRTMRDESSVGYITAPFQAEDEAYAIGRCVIDIWLQLTGEGKYLHPFGTIVSNDAAHSDFANLVGLTNESRDTNYLVFIFRAGASPKPVESERLPVTLHMYNQEQA
jgi:hypothetical protein